MEPLASLGADYMASFSPVGGLEFCCDYMTNFSPGLQPTAQTLISARGSNLKFDGKSEQKPCKMASSIRLVKIRELLVSQFSLFVSTFGSPFSTCSSPNTEYDFRFYRRYSTTTFGRHLVLMKTNHCACLSSLFYPGGLAFQPVCPG